MPSNTFFHLPEEKRRKLLDCALAEFARIPYADASINQIIRAAGIPRGSFYMYFTDKAELFRYLLSVFGKRVEATMSHILDQTGGDLLAAFLAFFDFVLADCRQSNQRSEYLCLIQVMHLNGDMRSNLFSSPGTPHPPHEVAGKIDLTLLNLKNPSDLGDVFRILVSATGSAIVDGVMAEDPAPIRARYINVLSILARGMAATPLPASPL